jgi:transcriptional regulator with XRE-family HTH domain
MGTLGQFLRSAREARGIDLHEAAQQTRISIVYLRALEAEDFSRLPGEVFVKGFLKNYGKFLHLDESQVMKRYGELNVPKSEAAPVVEKEPVAASSEKKAPRSTRIEPFLWGTGIVIALILFMFTSLPERHKRETKQVAAPMATGQTVTAQGLVMQTDKLYLEVVALEDTWLLVRTDNGPQKKALLKKGEGLIWSADDRFLLSYGSANSLKLMLNGQELVVNEPGNEVVRDLTVTASGVVNRKIQPENKLPRKKHLSAEQIIPSQELYGPRLTTTTTKMKKNTLFGPPAPQTRQTPTQTR